MKLYLLRKEYRRWEKVSITSSLKALAWTLASGPLTSERTVPNVPTVPALCAVPIVHRISARSRSIGKDTLRELIAVGSLTFVESVKNQLGFNAAHREVIEANGKRHSLVRPWNDVRIRRQEAF